MGRSYNASGAILRCFKLMEQPPGDIVTRSFLCRRDVVGFGPGRVGRTCRDTLSVNLGGQGPTANQC